MSEVVLKNVHKIYAGNVVAVKNVNLKIDHGEFLVLVGPSGCGKSTTLRMIAGLEEIDKGTITIGDRVINDVPPKDRDVAMVFQNYALYPHMTVYANMAFGLKLRKIKKPEIEKRVMAAAQTLGLEPYLKRRPKALSGGQRQRVAMGRAIVREPKVFLFDEPLSNLDAKMRVEMRREILHLHHRIATTMIYVTHDQVEAMTLGDRICVMRDGIIEQIGRPDKVFDHPATLFVAGFIGTPAMNVFNGTLKENEGELIFDAGSFTTIVPESKRGYLQKHLNRKVALGVRPRAMKIVDDEHGFEGKIDVCEMLGEEVLIHAQNGDRRFVVSTDPHLKEHLNECIFVKPLMDNAHIFDLESGINLTMPKE